MRDFALKEEDKPSLNDSYLLEKKLELMIESGNKKMANELKVLKDYINKLEGDIAGIKKQLNSIQAKTITFSENNKTTNNKVGTQNKASVNEAVKPRYGDYTPEDVPIEKFFYFGNKK